MSVKGLKELKERYPHIIIKDPGKDERNETFIDSPPRGNTKRMMKEMNSVVERLFSEEKAAKPELRRKVMQKNDKLVAQYAKQLDDKYNKKFLARNGLKNSKDLKAYKKVPEEILKEWLRMGKIGAGELTDVVKERLGVLSNMELAKEEKPAEEFDELLEMEMKVTREQYLKFLRE